MQGWRSVQSFFDDFDGVVAGALAFLFNNLTSWSCYFPSLTGTAGAATFLSLNMWPVIHQHILNHCDKLNGVADDILESPDICMYHPSGLICLPGHNS